MLKTLSEASLATYTPYEGAKLTPTGRQLAMKVIRRHRLLELFLVQTLDMPWDEVHEEAEHMEHAASERLIDRIDAFLGHPTVDPHGDPIPRSDGSLAETEGTPLADLPRGQTVPGRPGRRPGPGVPPLPDRVRARPQRRRANSSRTAPRPAPWSSASATGPSPSATPPRPRCWSSRKNGPGIRVIVTAATRRSARRPAPSSRSGARRRGRRRCRRGSIRRRGSGRASAGRPGTSPSRRRRGGGRTRRG